MSESTPHFAPLVVLIFLGAVFSMGVCLLVLLYGAARRQKFWAKIGASSAVSIAGVYLLLLLGFSLTSSEKVLPAGGWKYFCEIDCHIAYSIERTQTASIIGPEAQPVSAIGQFLIVQLRVWFDEHTISPRRGNGPLTPNPRRVVVVDGNGASYGESERGEAAVERASGERASLDQPLRPGQSFVKTLVFDVPKQAEDMRLLITEAAPETRLIIGDENSPLHKKVYFRLSTAPASALVFYRLAPGR